MSNSGVTRRDFVKTVGTTVVGVGLAGHTHAGEKPILTRLSAKKLAQMIANREVSAAEVAAAYLARIERVNPKINAIFHVDPDRILAEARQADGDLKRGVNRGPLHGVPFSIKDQLSTKGMITTNGCPELKSYVPAEDATVVKRLKDAGGILFGKTNVPEMCYHGISDNLVYGRTNNPYDLSRTPGGSSGGEAAIIAACGSPLGLGTDIGDSIRSPAHYCGIVGLKPTNRRVPETGMLSAFPIIFYDWNCIGPMARHVEDLELALQIVSGPDGRDPYVVDVPLRKSTDIQINDLKIIVCHDDGDTYPTAETRHTVEEAADALRRQGAHVVALHPPQLDRALDMWLLNIMPFWFSAAKYYPQQYAAITGTSVACERHFSTKSLMQYFQAWQKESDFGFDVQIERLAILQQYREEMTRFMEDYDAIVSPVLNTPAGIHPDPNVFLEGSAVEVWESFKAESGGYCTAQNLTGWPAVVVRGGTSPEGLPIGVHIAAKPWREDVALAVAGVIEKQLVGWQPPPNL
jgi:amidase